MGNSGAAAAFRLVQIMEEQNAAELWGI